MSVELKADTLELAKAYDEVSVVQFNHGQILIDGLAIQAGERVLDVGAGTGRLTEYVARLVAPDGEVVGIDPLEHRVSLASQRANGSLRFAVGQAEDLSLFEDARFNVVYLNSVFHWIVDKGVALREIFRVLKVGGRLGLTVQDPSMPPETRILLRAAIEDAGFGDRSNNAYFKQRPTRPFGVDAKTLECLVRSAGFGDFRTELRPIIDLHQTADQVWDLLASSAFGNFLAMFSVGERAAVKGSFEKRLEAKRTETGISLHRYLRYATARKHSMQEGVC